MPGKKIKSFFWKLFYSRWREGSQEKIPGYSVLVMIPGDLPVFLQIAMEVVARQTAEHLVEVIVIPDKFSQGLLRRFDAVKKLFSPGKVRLERFGALDGLVVSALNNPSHTHWLQLIRGIEASRATHAVIHDADAFVADSGFFDRHYKFCVERRLACVGASKVWDAWYESQGIRHLAATWELVVDIGWFESFKPWQHHGQENTVFGKQHVFDTTLLPQCLTPPEAIGRLESRDGCLIHFNYVISTYRFFQRTRGPFEDGDFKLLLIRLLIDAFDGSGSGYEIPSLGGLIRGIQERDQRVTYVEERTRNGYAAFRAQLGRLIHSGMLNEERKETLLRGVLAFDKALGYDF